MINHKTLRDNTYRVLSEIEPKQTKEYIRGRADEIHNPCNRPIMEAAYKAYQDGKVLLTQKVIDVTVINNCGKLYTKKTYSYLATGV